MTVFDILPGELVYYGRLAPMGYAKKIEMLPIGMVLGTEHVAGHDYYQVLLADGRISYRSNYAVWKIEQ